MIAMPPEIFVAAPGAEVDAVRRLLFSFPAPLPQSGIKPFRSQCPYPPPTGVKDAPGLILSWFA
jgi:hypothetical protein